MRRAFVLLAIAGALACGKAPKQSPNPQQGRGQILYPEQLPRRDVPDDLARIAQGAVVVDRTGELSLSASAFSAIDSDIYSQWMSPPSDPQQSVTIALGTRTRVDRVGIDYSSAPLPGSAVRTMIFEASVDGATFAPLTTQTLRRDAVRQWIAVLPSEATHIRATIRDTFDDKSDSAVAEIMVAGKEVAPWVRPDVTGTWMLNNESATMVQTRGQVFGKIDMNPPMILEGGWEGRILRFFWLRANNQWGYGLLTVTPDGTRLTGVFWHESPISPFLATTWFGEKKSAKGEMAGDGILEAWLTKYRRAPLHALSYRGDVLDIPQSAPALDRVARVIASHPQTRFALTAYEVREPDRARASARARKRLDSLMTALKERGVDLARIEPRVVGNDPALIQNDDMQRVIYSRIDLERN